MQQLLWKTIRATGVTDAAKTATETVVSMATRKLTEAATAEFERRWMSAAAESRAHKPASPARKPASPARERAEPVRRPGKEAATVTADRDQDSLRRLRASIAALDARIDTLAAG